MEEYGIGRVPRDVDTIVEKLAEIEAVELMRKHTPQPDYPNGRRLDCGCVVYYRSHVMNASIGTACADCYDEMSD
jgi:hypothetical protein